MRDSSAECDHTDTNKGIKMQHTEEATGILIPEPNTKVEIGLQNFSISEFKLKKCVKAQQ